MIQVFRVAPDILCVRIVTATDHTRAPTALSVDTIALIVNDPIDHAHHVYPASAMGDGIRTRHRLIIGIVCSSTPSII